MRALISIFLMLPLILGGLPVAAHNPIPNCSSYLFAPEQLAALKNAKSDYLVRVLAGDVNGIQRTVILLGEEHVKDEAAWNRGAAVVDQIPDVGFEGAKSSEHGPVFRIVVKGYSLLYKIAMWKGLKGSTIGYARSRPNSSELNTHLEAGHKFTMTEKMLMPLLVAGGAVEVVIGGGLLYSMCLIPTGVVAGDPFISVGGVLGTGIFLTVSKAWHLVTGRVGEAIATYVLCGSRNETMVKNLTQHFAERPDVTQMLVIVGRTHVDGMNHLLNKLNFWNVPL